ncbi:hypothetical protein IP84_01380 [beta proteobacterium AAP99]|nr:hypothetical protein IP84_01380 [beta proteobacterium AAP99]
MNTRALALRSAALAALGVLWLPMVSAQTATTTFNVTATVAKICNVSATTLAFGSYDPSSAGPLDQSSTISVRCTRTTPFTVSLNTGGTGGTFASRVMRDTAPTPNTLNYNLFTTTARTTVWGDGTAGTAPVGGTGLGMAAGNAVALTVFGRIPVQPTAVPSTTYSDTITVSVAY